MSSKRLNKPEDNAVLRHVRELIVELLVNEPRSYESDDLKPANNNEVEHDLTICRERKLEEKLAHVLVQLATEQENLRLAASAGSALLEELSVARDEIEALRHELDHSTASIITCERCGSREVEMTQLEQSMDQLRRRCFELELESERQEKQQRVLRQEVTLLQQRNREESLETASAQQELEAVAAQLKEQTEKVEKALAGRDLWRRKAHRLELETVDLRERLTMQQALVTKLESTRVRVATQLQMAETRNAKEEAETTRVTEMLKQLQKQSKERRCRTCCEAVVREKEAEQLLDDATREVTALRLENKRLRRRYLCTNNELTTSIEMTAAEVLALGELETFHTVHSNHHMNKSSTAEIQSTTRTALASMECVPAALPHVSIDSTPASSLKLAPLYFGLSVLACATAAGLLARR